MKKVIYSAGLVAMALSFSATAGSFVRIKCDDQNTGAEISINGRSVGACPVDAAVEAGTVRLQARKTAGDYEQLFEKQLTVTEGVPQRVEVILSAPQLTSAGRLRQEAVEAGKQLQAAEAGDTAAMKKIAGYYETGLGVKQDAAKARIWREKIEATAAQEQVRSAEASKARAMAGDIAAMQEMAARYDSGMGVAKDSAQALAWREKAEVATREKKVADKKARLAAAAPFRDLRDFMQIPASDKSAKNLVGFSSISWLALPFSTIKGITELPSDLTEMQKINAQAATRPSRWGNPESMIARAAGQGEAGQRNN
ncbi:MAG: hypothetical protein PSX71_00350 [bacterium]|nr:hypothetical protein [bacterium]